LPLPWPRPRPSPTTRATPSRIVRSKIFDDSQYSRYSSPHGATAQETGRNSYKVTGLVKDRDKKDHRFNCRIDHREVASWNVSPEAISDSDKKTAAAIGAGVLGLAILAAAVSGDKDHDNKRNAYEKGESSPFDDMGYLKQECTNEVRRHLDRDHGSVRDLELTYPHLNDRTLTGNGRVSFERGGHRELSFNCDFDRRGQVQDGHYSYADGGGDDRMARDDEGAAPAGTAGPGSRCLTPPVLAASRCMLMREARFSSTARKPISKSSTTTTSKPRDLTSPSLSPSIPTVQQAVLHRQGSRQRHLHDLELSPCMSGRPCASASVCRPRHPHWRALCAVSVGPQLWRVACWPDSVSTWNGVDTMNYHQILALIAVLTGNAGDDFATLKSGGADPKAPIAQILCPRPLPANEIEGKTVFCGTVQAPEDHAKPDGKKITLQFSILKSGRNILNPIRWCICKAGWCECDHPDSAVGPHL
jgi:hypothetical protein